MSIKVTVCELHDEPDAFADDWERLVIHVHKVASQFIILPEMPFYPWFANSSRFDESIWREAILAHNSWQTRLNELSPATILSSRPIAYEELRLNEGFAWDRKGGYQSIHCKYYLPDEEGVWEASWYQNGDGSFSMHSYQDVCIGMLLCTELWGMEHARAYGKAGTHLLVVPRTTEYATLDKWIAGGRTAAILAGAFCVSSNRVGVGGNFGGRGWVIGPDGDILGLTSTEQPFISFDIDILEAEKAKTTYPRSIFFT